MSYALKDAERYGVVLPKIDARRVRNMWWSGRTVRGCTVNTMQAYAVQAVLIDRAIRQRKEEAASLSSEGGST